MTLTTTLASMRTHNDAGTTFSVSDVESTTSSVANLLQLAVTELNGVLPTLPPGAATVAQAFEGSLTSVLEGFREH